MVRARASSSTMRITDRDHEVQRHAWAAGWFVSLLRGRRENDARELGRAQTGLAALGIQVTFQEDEPRRTGTERKEARDE